VTIFVDRAGLSASDGATHHGIFDVSFLSQIPNMKIYAPISEASLKRAMKEALALNSPVAIRYPNASENKDISSKFIDIDSTKELSIKIDFEKNDTIDIMIITHGKILSEAEKAKNKLKEQGIKVGIILLEVLKPYDKIAQTIASIIPSELKGIISLEEEIKSGGVGMNLYYALKKCSDFDLSKYTVMATDDTFVAKRCAGQSIYDAANISADHIFKEAIKLYEEK